MKLLSGIIVTLVGFTNALKSPAGKTYQPINFRGRCAFGEPCDSNRLSFGCERFNEKVGLCWSECAGILPSHVGESAHFKYEGWCYNINSNLLTAPEDSISGKKAMRSYDHYRQRRDDETDVIDDYDWESIGADGMIMGIPLEYYAECKTESDCEEAARNCAIGCGNREEVQLIDNKRK